MNVIPTKIPGVLIIEPKVFHDDRGFFLETYQVQRYAGHTLPNVFVQDNISRSRHGVLRGMHYQVEKAQGKLVGVTRGTVFDVAVDARRGSPTFGQWVGVELSDQNHRQFYLPPGCAHGFCVMSEEADFYYKCTDYYHPGSEVGIRWDDPNIAIEWPIKNPILAPKDCNYPCLKDVPSEKLINY
jgi:dTDP-4-dehydrorhamnose 3,5-epimerase